MIRLQEAGVSRGHRAHRRRTRPVVLTVAALTLAACSGGGGADSSGAAGGPPQSGGTLTYLTFNEVVSFDPVVARPVERSGDVAQFSAVYDALVYEQPTDAEMQMGTAKSMTSSDSVHWKVQIRPDIKFSDGKAYDAKAVKFNWERIADPSNNSPNAAALSTIKKLTVTDALTLDVTLAKPNGQFPRLIAHAAPYIASPTAIQKEGASYGENPVGAGPFTVASWVRDSTLNLDRNEDYWRGGRPYLDELVFQQVIDTEQRYNTLTSDGGDMAESGPDLSYAEKAEDAGYQTLPYTPSGGIMVLFNTHQPPLDDVRVRQALAKAIDNEAINTAINKGAAEVPETLFVENSPFYNADLRLPEADPDTGEAQDLIDDYAADHGPVEFELTTTPISQKTSELVQAQWGELDNVDVGLDVVDPTQIAKTYAEGGFQAGVYALNGTDPEPGMYELYHTGGSANFGRLSDPELDAALEKGRSSQNEADRREAYDAAQRRLLDIVPQVYYQRYGQSAIYTDSVQGLEYPNTGPLWADVWLSE